MRKLLLVVVCLMMTASAALAQGSPRSEFYIGYSNLQAEGLPNRSDPSDLFSDDFFSRRKGLHGANVSGVGFIGSVFGFKGDFSINRNDDSRSFTGGRNTIRNKIFYLMGGPTLKFHNSGRVEPFVHALAGIAHTRFEVEASRDLATGTVRTTFETSATDFAAAFGGGLDVRIGERLGIRVFQVDYAPVFLRDRSIRALASAGAIAPFTLDGKRQDNLRFSIGIIF